ncbi:MAG TPA: fibronectin type III domain-containing protein, partial [Gaiellaceae bacterium]|nr:fibronectin type III domain-containing protein [Gaiellaceae bacterium]
MPTRSPLTVLFALLLAAAFASASASGQSAGPPGGSPPGLEQAIAVKERNAERLLDTPGIVGVGVGVNPAGKPVIHVYTETQGTPGVPGSLEGFDVQRVVTGVLQPRAPTDRFPRPVPIGVSSGHYDFATGTLGVRVTDGTNVYALSNNHVFAAVNGASIGDPILQPGPIEDGGTDPADRIGTLYDFQTINFDTGSTNTMDAAIALTSASLVGTSTPPDGYGAPSSVTTAAFSGQGVQKYGRTTGFQLGSVVDTSLSVDVCYVYLIFCWQEARFVNQISVSPGTFSAGGDSGSLIVEQGSNQPVALLFAGGDGLTIGSPIDTVLQRFGVTIDGAPLGDGPPSAPIALSALAGDGSVSLSWSPPTFDGGSPVTGYRVYRGTSPGAESFLADAGTSTSYVDGSAANGTTYYYKVSAENANGESALSTGASATPSALVPPDEPLPTLDDFDRGSENPLSDGGRWSNAVNGGVENGLYVSSNELACSVTTTCTAWRNDSQYGPDSEAWARIGALPGSGNAIRLYVRLQSPGTSGYDGYMLRTNQLAGTDEVFVERIDNSSLARLLT